ncbi:hypothetical protein JHK84_043010 [Glycine max]|nr:hypothetical protein JHK86_042801 [Glycine max]KAG5116897.1 hypothetical protein JHK84_043010 [Glycine max]
MGGIDRNRAEDLVQQIQNLENSPKVWQVYYRKHKQQNKAKNDIVSLIYIIRGRQERIINYRECEITVSLQ